MDQDRHTHVICYDVTDKRRRAKLARFLEGRGVRVQYSVFEVLASPSEIDELLEQATDEPLFDPEQDSLRCYRLCGECLKRTRVFGTYQEVQRPGEPVVL